MALTDHAVACVVCCPAFASQFAQGNRQVAGGAFDAIGNRFQRVKIRRGTNSYQGERFLDEFNEPGSLGFSFLFSARSETS